MRGEDNVLAGILIVAAVLGMLVGVSTVGALTYNEAVPLELQAFFKSFDANNDGELSLDEAETFYYWVEENIQYRYDDEQDENGLKELAEGLINVGQLGDGRGGADYSQTPYETWNERYGDCEDMAISEVAFYDYFGVEAYVGSVNAEGYEIDHAICIAWAAETREDFFNLTVYLSAVDYYLDFEGNVFIIVDNAYSDEFGFITSELNDQQFSLMDVHTLEEELGIEEEMIATPTPITEQEPGYEPEPDTETSGFSAIFAIVGIVAIVSLLEKRK